VLVLVPGRSHGEPCCSAASATPSAKPGTARAHGPEGAVERFGMDDAYPIADLDDILPGLIEGRSRVYYHFGREAEFDLKLIGWVNRVRAQIRHGADRRTSSSSSATCCTSLRLFKSARRTRS
jgi:Xaa-Pro aminopeptidase